MKVKAEIKEKIMSVANALAAEGNDTPTNEQVRERMGGGSLSHISPVMREWRDSRKAEVVAALEMPSDLKKVIESSVGQVWTTASKLASTTVETVRLEADAAVQAATGERDEALAEITRLEERMAELNKTLADREQVINQGQAALEQEKARSAQLSVENAGLMARVGDREEQVKSLKDELKEARDDHKALQSELVEIAKKTKK